MQSYKDEGLRIVPDEQFEAVKAKFGLRKRSDSGAALSADLVRTFTGHLYCEHCSAFYSRESKNAKGEYVYYQCGCRQGRGPESCSNTIKLREDNLLAALQCVCSMVFSDIEGMVEAAVVEAPKAVQSNRSESDRVWGDLVQVERESARVSALLIDPDVMAEPLAKKAILRKSAEIEGRREALQMTLSAPSDRAGDCCRRTKKKTPRTITCTG